LDSQMTTLQACVRAALSRTPHVWNRRPEERDD
jgi:hypothetical protein